MLAHKRPMPVVRVLGVFVSAVALLCGGVSGQEESELKRIRDLEKQVEKLASQLELMSKSVKDTAAEFTGFTPAEKRLAWYERHEAMKGNSPFSDLEWQFLGPTNISGRVTDVAVPEPRGQDWTIYVATASGGVWKTANEGTTWEPIFENAASTAIGDVTIAPSNKDIIWIGTGEANIFRSSMAGAGVYKSIDAGKTWKHMGLEGTHTIPRIVIHPKNPDIVWVASSGHEWTWNEERGIYKTTDGGETWKKVFHVDKQTGAIDLVINPSFPKTLYVATWQRIRKRWNDPRNEPDYSGSSIYKTTDGGKSWDEIAEGLPPASARGRIGIDLCATEPNVIYAFIDNYEPSELPARQGRRRGGRRRGNAEADSESKKPTESSETKEGNAGEKGTKPEGEKEPEAKTKENTSGATPERRGRRGDRSEGYRRAGRRSGRTSESEGEEEETDSYGRPDKKRIKGAEIYRSDDAGKTWKKVSESNRQMNRLAATYGWVFGQIRVDPNDADTIYVMGLGLNVSNDSGKTFRRLRGMHGDHHALWIDPANPQYLVNGNDGGVDISYDGGKNWKGFNHNLPVVQFYNVAYDMATPFNIYGSIQDHGSRKGVVDIRRGRNRIRPQEWTRAPGGEASIHAIDPTDPNTVYSEGFYGSISRTELKPRKRSRIAPKTKKGEDKLRGQWLAPFIISPHNPRIIYHGMNVLYRSMDRGEGFESISPDLTYNDQGKIGDIQYQTIWAISESPLAFGVIYVGTDDGRVHVTHDSGGTWKEITAGAARNRWISRLVASQYDAGTVYMAQNGKRHDDFAPYLWKSTDHGHTWQNIAANIPSGPINVIREDPKDRNILYVGTDLGVYVSTDGAATWNILNNGLPTTYVHDLVIHPRDDIMVIATHGRGMYAMDVRPIRNPEEEVQAEAAEAAGSQRQE